MSDHIQNAESANFALQQPEWRVLSSLFPQVHHLPDLAEHRWQRERFRAGQALFNPGNPCTRFVLLAQGRVRIQLRSPQDRRLTLYRVQPGQLCLHSLINLVNREDFAFEAIAETDGWISWTTEDHFNRWLDDSSDFRQWIFASFGERMKEILERLARLTFAPLEWRLADLLLERLGSDGNVMATQAELAAELGSAREVVNRQLKRWENLGWIHSGRGKIEVVEVSALLKFLESSEDT
ncbi:MAG: Crp/Fnr family transcriptional regulator [Granulosicoccaceae bacterium]